MDTKASVSRKLSALKQRRSCLLMQGTAGMSHNDKANLDIRLDIINRDIAIADMQLGRLWGQF